jgi:hypothetical protein
MQISTYNEVKTESTFKRRYLYNNDRDGLAQGEFDHLQGVETTVEENADHWHNIGAH